MTTPTRAMSTIASSITTLELKIPFPPLAFAVLLLWVVEEEETVDIVLLFDSVAAADGDALLVDVVEDEDALLDDVVVDEDALLDDVVAVKVLAVVITP
jgi:hypothetical protein